MQGHAQLGSAGVAVVDQGDPPVPLAEGFRHALRTRDVNRAGEMIVNAARAGAPAGPLYVEVMRPALTAVARAGVGQARFARGAGETILADLIAAVPLGRRAGTGRAAVLLCRETGVEALDGRAVGDFLQHEGWNIDRMGADGPASDFPAAAGASGIELAVAVATGPEDVLRLGPACSGLGRLPDPPVIAVCDFSGRPASRTAAVLGADVIAGDPQELVRSVAEKLPAPGSRRWGVRLSRRGDALILTPTGLLDATSVDRLADVGLTRVGTFSRLVVDLRDLAEIDRSGLARLATWPDLSPLRDVELLLLADAEVRQRLAGGGSPRMRIVDAVDG